MGRGGGKVKTGTFGKRRTKSARAGVVFPVARIKRCLKQRFTKKQRVASGAPVYLAAVMEYLTAEIIELASNAARDHKRRRIIPRHIMLAVRHDEELASVCKRVTFASAGVMPNLSPALLKSSKTKAPKQKAAKATQSTSTAAKKPEKPKATVKPQPQQKGGKKGVGITILGEKVLHLGQKLSIISADIVQVNADAIIHPTNDTFYLGGQVGSRMEKVGGQAFRNNVNHLHNNVGALGKFQAALCPGINFAARFVIHCNGPSWSGTDSLVDLETTVHNCLKLADAENFKSICFPSIGSGNAGFPKQPAAQTILRAISRYFKQTVGSSIKHVYFDLFDQSSVDIWTSELSKLEMEYL